jgi:probable phosphoglycerate mutase
VIAVSHADPIKIAIADALGQPIDLMQRTVVSPCSVSVISYGSVLPTVLTVNSTGTLSDLGLPPESRSPKKGSRR